MALLGYCLTCVQASNGHCFTKNSVPDEKREMMNKCPTNSFMNGLVNKRILGESIKDLPHFGNEFAAETSLLRLVPELRFSKVKFGSAPDLDIEAQRISRSRRAFTSGQGL